MIVSDSPSSSEELSKMADSPFHEAVYVTGPTASGKTELGIALARRLDAEVIALDSMTLYRGMDIATAKPTIEERRGIPHHLIDVIDPWEKASVSAYREWALAALLDIRSRNKLALFVGGTPLYLKVLLRGMFTGPGSDDDLRQRLEQDAIAQGDRALHQRLSRVDPTTAARLHPQDRRRVIRALEVLELTGRPISQHQREHDRPAPAHIPVFALDLPRPSLHARINRRVTRFFENGLIDEVRILKASPQPLCEVAQQAIGYREALGLLEGTATLDQTVAQIQARTRQFAKRQMTWFRHLEEVEMVPIDPDFDAEVLAAEMCARIERARNER
jgi:tRNA dimethylallyltransferase